MKTAVSIILITILLQACKVQERVSIDHPHTIDNYTNGALDIKVAPFGLNGSEITVGSVRENGDVHFDWPEMDMSTIADSDFFLGSIKNTVGMTFCNKKEIEQSDKSVKVLKVDLMLYENGSFVRNLYPATQKEVMDNGSLNRHTSLVLGSQLSWYYCDGDTDFKAMCSVNYSAEGLYDFAEVTTYDLSFKKGWNLVRHTLLEKEDWKGENGAGSLPKTISVTSLEAIPDDINWFL